MHRTAVVRFIRFFMSAAVISVVAISMILMLRRGDAEPGSAKTLLAERIETARQIREALAKPIPPPEPLGPITARPAAQPAKAARTDGTSPPKLSRSARDAMAQDVPRSSYSASPDVPRSSYSASVYRHGSGGW
jgi:hypothetical protein